MFRTLLYLKNIECIFLGYLEGKLAVHISTAFTVSVHVNECILYIKTQTQIFSRIIRVIFQVSFT